MRHRWGGARLVAMLAATLVAIVVTGGVTSMAMADNEGRRICVYGTQDLGDEKRFAVTDYKKADWRKLKYINYPCPPRDEADFLTATGWDVNQGSYKWEKYSIDKVPCEHFLDEYLRGVVPATFQEKRRDYFCDNTEDDALYEFVVKVTSSAEGQAHIEVKATKTE